MRMPYSSACRVSSQNAVARQQARIGQTMLELVAATIIIAIALVPTLKFSRKSLESLERVEQSERCHIFCVSKLEETLAQTSFAWSTANLSGDFSISGWGQYRFQVTRGDSASVGGIPDSLAVVSARVWFDANSNGNFEADEVNCQIETKLAKIQTLQDGTTK
jgi:hypothetical protein